VCVLTVQTKVDAHVHIVVVVLVLVVVLLLIGWLSAVHAEQVSFLSFRRLEQQMQRVPQVRFPVTECTLPCAEQHT